MTLAPIRQRLFALIERLRPLAERYPRVLAAGLLGVAVVFWWGIASIAAFTYDVTTTLPGRKELSAIGDMAQATVLYDVHDQPVFTIFKEQRIEFPVKQMSPNLLKAVVSVEDQRFYQHAGVDFVGITTATLRNIRRSGRPQGASTITQQLARLSYPEQISLHRVTLRRKLKEAVFAAIIERNFTKDEILQFYLNKVYFGDGFHGVETAARGFLGKSSADLTVDEAAMLAGLIQSPSNYAPTISMEKAVARRNMVLRAMLETGAIDQSAYDRAKLAKIKVQNGLQRDEEFGQYFKEQVRRELVDRFGWPRVSEGGLKVYTTIDPDMQKAAEDMMEESLSKIEARKNYKHQTRAVVKAESAGTRSDYLQGALMAIEPDTGYVRVMVGGRNFKESRFNRAVQAHRQPGSAFKPFVYAAAIERGMTPATLITNLDEAISTPQGGWMPEDEHLTASSLTLRSALRSSSNRAAVQLLNTVGIGTTVGFVDRLHMGKMPRVPSLALGAGEVTLQSLTSAYAAFANGGASIAPILVRRVEDQTGAVIFSDTPKREQVYDEKTAFLVANMLTDVINAGTATRARANGFTLPAAGKTGTTNDYVDAWFVGFTPHLVAGVWVGFDQPQTIISNGYGGELAVPLWADFMKIATKGDKAEWIERPDGIVAVDVCRLSGKRPTDGCTHVEVETKTGDVQIRDMVYTEYFVRGTEPYDTCDLHGGGGNFFHELAGIFRGGRDQAAPVKADEVGLPEQMPTQPAHQTPGQPAANEAKPANGDAGKDEPEKRKKGFWGRLFGSRKKDTDEKPNEKKEPQEQKPPDPKPYEN
jgi:penicillin-binding protein 1A